MRCLGALRSVHDLELADDLDGGFAGNLGGDVEEVDAVGEDFGVDVEWVFAGGKGTGVVFEKGLAVHVHDFKVDLHAVLSPEGGCEGGTLGVVGEVDEVEGGGTGLGNTDDFGEG